MTTTESTKYRKKRSAEITNPTQPSVPSAEELRAQQQAQHSAVISLIVAKNVKIQKEIGRNWRLRDIQKKVTETNKILNEFEDAVWPLPKTKTERRREKVDAAAGIPRAIGNDGTELGKTISSPNDTVTTSEMGDSETTTVTDTATTEEGVSLGDDTDERKSFHGVENENGEVVVQEPVNTGDFEDEVVVVNYETTDVGGVNSLSVATNELDDGMDVSVLNSTHTDGLSELEPMHRAVSSALSCYCLILCNMQRVTAKIVEITLECISLLITNRYVSGRADKQEKADNEERKTDLKDLCLFNLIDSICCCADSTSHSDQISMAKLLLALMTSANCGVHEAAMLKAVRAVFHVFLVSKSLAAKEVCKAVLLDMLKSVFTRMEAYDVMLQGDNTWDDDASSMSSFSNWEGKQDYNDNRGTFASQFHTDGYLLFRALCKLSAKPLREDADDASKEGGVSSAKLALFKGTSDPLASKSKILALELILSIFENCGVAFKKGEKFLYAVQNYLCESLLKNCMSNNTAVVHLSLKIFLNMVYKFKAHLKAEIEVFVANIFLPVLESRFSPFKHKRLVLDALRALCSDPVTLTQIFLNYDCDFDAVNLYRIIVHNLTALSKKSRGIPNPSSKTQANTIALSVGGLEVLVITMRAFLKALNLPGGDDNFDGEDSIFLKQLDVGMAAAKTDTESYQLGVGATAQSEMDISSKDIEKMQSSEDIDLDNSANGLSSAENVAGKIVDVFDRKRTAQENFEMGSVKFSGSLKKGLLFFIECGFFHLDAKEIALFFLEHKETLDMTQIGEVLGKEPESSFVKDKGADPEKGGLGFYVRVLHHYVEALDFSSIEFDGAIRIFLSGFRLPGEAQKIDRIMEKFAERYTRQNEDIFPSADTAFILAFSVIMLQTDLHNPSIKPEKRMTVDSFIRNNRGISVDGGDLPEAFLTGIFKRIQKEPFTLKEDDDARAVQAKATKAMYGTALSATGLFLTSAEDRRRERFRKERAELMAASEILFKKKSTPEKSSSSVSSELTESVCPADVVKPMFDITWGPLLVTLSQVLEMAEDDSSISLALNGFVYCVRISAQSGMTKERHTFIISLAKFTTLGSIQEMKRKNIECIRTLLSIAIMDGEYLGESWQPVLQCISQLGRLQLFASGAPSNDDVLGTDDTEGKKQSENSGSYFQSTPKVEMARETEENNGRAVLEAINEVLIEKVFSSSVNLSPTSIVHFVDCLVAVSETEIEGDSKKGISGVSRRESLNHTEGTLRRTFSLQRLVEVADWNMNVRPRLIWADMWNLMAKHFAKIGCHQNSHVSMFAIDALRQLSCKFLEKPELSDFNFQRLFLQPFLSIMQNSQSSVETRELVLQCVDNILRSGTRNLKSGWKIFFSILAASGCDGSEKISTFGLAILQRLLDDHLDDISRFKRYEGQLIDDKNVEELDKTSFDRKARKKARNSNVEDFIGLCRASLAFVERDNQLPIGLSMRALCHASIYADLIATGRVLPPVSGAQSHDPSAFGYTYPGLLGQEADEMVLWRPILDGLAKGMHATVRSSSGGVGCVLQRGSVMTLRAILLCHGENFSATQWTVILEQVILPAMQKAAETDCTPVIGIISESPTVSNLDFLSDPLPLPPSHDDEGLQNFAVATQNDESAPSRSFGKSELLVEASFADLRHGGDGNLGKVHELVKKAAEGVQKNAEQPFPDSWVATVAPIALGMLTDLFSEKIVSYGVEGRELLWPMIIAQMERWAIGDVLVKVKQCDLPGMEDKSWKPCEALVRIGCKEISRLSQTLIDTLPRLDDSEGKAWLNTHCLDIAGTISKNLEVERLLHSELIRTKSESLSDKSSDTREGGVIDTTSENEVRISTSYGMGSLFEKRSDIYEEVSSSPIVIDVQVVKLDSGATLYSPTLHLHPTLSAGTDDGETKAMEKQNLDPKYFLRKYIRPLKLRCIASFCLQRILPIMFEALSSKARKHEVSALLEALDKSRVVARDASLDKNLSQYFKEAKLMEWGEEGLDDDSTPGGEGHRASSEMFFLTQDAGANKAIILFLSHLYRSKDQGLNNEWDTVAFAEVQLLDRMLEVLQKFIISESAEAEHIDPNVWRMSSESGGKIAVYCTSFAAVVVLILKTILCFNADQFERQKEKIFPFLCSLVRVQSEEIRKLVAEVLREKVGAVIGI